MNTPGRSFFSKAATLLMLGALVVGAIALSGCGANTLLGEGGPDPAAELPGTWLPSSNSATETLVINRGGDAYFGSEADKFTWRVLPDQTDPSQLVFVHKDASEEVRAFSLSDDGKTLTLFEGEAASGTSMDYERFEHAAAEE